MSKIVISIIYDVVLDFRKDHENSEHVDLNEDPNVNAIHKKLIYFEHQFAELGILILYIMIQ